MRGLRSTLVLLVLFVAIGGYAYFIESERDPAADTDGTEPAYDVEADTIVTLAVTADNGDTTELRRASADDAWAVTTPVDTPADATAVSAIVNGLADLEIRRVVDENATDLAMFGLDPPVFSLTFGTGATTLTVAVGDASPAGGSRYATLDGGPRVFLVADYLESTLNRTTFELRDRSVLDFTAPDVVGLEIVRDTGAIRFAKAEGAWRLVDPLAGRADFGLVEGLAGRLASGEMLTVEIEAATEAELADYGLDAPQLRVAVDTQGENPTLLVGRETDTGTVYARDASRSMVFTIDAAMVDDLARDATAYRESNLFDFRPFNATQVTLAREGRITRFEKGSAADNADDTDDTWRRLEPDPGEIDRPTMDGVLIDVSDLDATTFVDSRNQTGLDTPFATVTVTFDEGKQETVSFGQTADATYATRDDEPGAAVVDRAAVDEALEALETVDTLETVAPDADAPDAR